MLRAIPSHRPSTLFDYRNKNQGGIVGQKAHRLR
jgi:hypothetical protein